MTPFEYSGLKRSSNTSKPLLGFDEVFIDGQADETRVLDDERDNINYRLLGLMLMAAFVVLLGRLYTLQGMRGEEYRAQAEGNKSRQQYILAPRGLILDQYGKTIASNAPSFELVAIPADLPIDEGELNAKLDQLVQITAHDKQEMMALLSAMDRTSFQPQTLAQNISKDAALTIIGLANDFKGFAVQNNPIRDYKDPLIFSHLVGYTGKVTQDELNDHQNQNYLLNDYIGKTGLEVEYENYLKGKSGQRPSEIDAQGNLIKSLQEIPPVPGNNLKLNVDYDLQKVLYDSLTAQMVKFNETNAAAVVSNPKTGQIIALMSLPSFDNNWFARGISQPEYSSLINDKNIPLLNRVTSGQYPPGSTVKPMLAIAALTEGTITPKTIVIDDGVIRIGSYTFYGYNRAGLGPMDVYSAIARSSDIFFYTIGGGNPKNNIEGLGQEKLAEWFRKFHLGKPLGLDLPNEKSGLVPDEAWKKEVKNEPWYLGDTYHYAIGQGDLLATPLQINSWTSTIANGGKIMQPYILDEVVDIDGKTVFKNQPKVLQENFLDPQWVKVAQDGMRQTITAGSAQSLKTLPVEISGKTGTAQIISNNLSETHAWFTAYAPSNDPQLAITILVERAGEGSSVSVPVAKDVFAWWAANRWNK